MELPNYFLVDLPAEAALTGDMITEASQTLKRNRQSYLQRQSTYELVRTISELTASWLEPEFQFRRMALAAAHEAGFSPATMAAGLDAFFRQWTAEKIEHLLVQELGHPARLDELSASAAEQKFGRVALAQGPEFLVHIAAGNIPVPALSSMILGLLVRSAQFIKCASGASLVPRLFAHSLYQLAPKLAACMELAEWVGGRDELETPLFREADCVTATGSDESLVAIRHRLPVHVRFVAHGHRVSFGYVSRKALSGLSAAGLMGKAAKDVVAWDQLGCLSPHVFYVERGGRISAEQFAEGLANELERHESLQPRGKIPQTTAAAIATRRAFYEVRAAHSGETRQWASSESTAWTVVFEADARFQVSCLHRFIYVKAVADLKEALEGADAVRGRVSTVGLAVAEEEAQEWAMALARWGATRICGLGEMQNPPLMWRQDGRPTLGELVTWTDWEQK